jgi:hypothetical protein
MKIALSASFFNDFQVFKALDSCEVIYTTQVHNYEALRNMFGSRVFIIPFSTPSMLEYLKSQHEGAEFLDYSDLFLIHHPSVSVRIGGKK